jgi:hypothetical protein
MSNDITIIVSIVLFLMLVGAAIPLINDSFSSTYTTTANGTVLYNSVEAESGGGALTIWSVLSSMIASIFWTFGVADWLNLFVFMPLRLLLLLLLARNIWVGGGA